MSAMSDYLENELFDHVLRAAAYASPGTVWLALSTANPGEDGSGLAEPAGGAGYARLQIDGTTRAFSAPAGGAGSNAQNWEFPAATASWGTVTHYAIVDAATAGNVLVYGALTSGVSVGAGKIIRFLAGEIDVSFAGAFSNYLGDALYDHVLRGIAYAAPDSKWIALSTTTVNADGTGVSEPASGDGYARLEIGGPSGRDFPAPVDGANDNPADWEFAPATGAWGTLTHAGLMDAATGGNLLYYGVLSGSVSIGANEVFRFPAGDLDASHA